MKIEEKDIINKDFKYMWNMSEDEVEDYLYEITQSLSKEEAKNLITIYLDIANRRGYSYNAPIFKKMLEFYNLLNEK